MTTDYLFKTSIFVLEQGIAPAKSGTQLEASNSQTSQNDIAITKALRREHGKSTQKNSPKPSHPQRAQYPLIKEYSLNHNMKPYII